MNANKEKAVRVSRQAEGLLTKVNTMIETDAYCPDVIQQIDAVSGLLRRTRLELLKGHLDHCLEHKIKENKARTVDELLKIYNLSK